jgi:hypothetical protein
MLKKLIAIIFLARCLGSFPANLNAYATMSDRHNQFREQATLRIDKNHTKQPNCSDIGTPNASVRLLISMMILKDSQALSDMDIHIMPRKFITRPLCFCNKQNFWWQGQF